jgi:hypothetical protein
MLRNALCPSRPVFPRHNGAVTTRKRKTLPDNFDALLQTASLDDLKAVFDHTEVDAYGGYHKGTALSFEHCPDELTRWLVARALDVDGFGKDIYTPLSRRARQNDSSIDVLLDLGAAIEGVNHSPGYQHMTPLLDAAEYGPLRHVVTLVARGADLTATYCGRTALDLAVWRCDDRGMATSLPKVEYLWSLTVPRPSGLRGLFAGRPQRIFAVTDEMRKAVKTFGRELETDRANQSWRHEPGCQCSWCAFDAGVHRLYELFDLPPVAPIVKHDGVSPIRVTATGWKAQHAQLWDALVPSSGAAQTAQGEAIRITGRIAHEILDNGGGNWDDDFRAMQRTLLDILASGHACDGAVMANAHKVVARIAHGQFDEPAVEWLEQVAVSWVLDNPRPLPCPPVAYRR